MNFSAPEQFQRQQAMALFQNPPGVDDPRTPSGSSPAYLPLDATSAAKQMAALNATSQHRRASQSGGTSDTLFGPRHPHLDVSTPDAANTATQPNRGLATSAQVFKSRRDEFLKFVSGVMNARQTPLPSTITGIPSAYDPATSPWKSIEPTAEPGGFRLAGKDIDLFKLWQLVFSHGGHSKLTRESGWSTLLSHFGLPEEFPESQGSGNSSVARLLSQYYVALLSPFEDVYFRNVQQQKALQARQQQMQQQHTQLLQNRQPQQQQRPGSTTFQGHNIVDPATINPSPQQSQMAGQGLASSSRLLPISAAPPQTQPDLLQQMSAGAVRYDQYHASPSHGSEAVLANQSLPSETPSPIAQRLTPAPHAPDLSQTVVDSDSNNVVGQIDPPALSHGDNKSGDIDGRKRKLQEEEFGKRVRQRTDSSGIGQQTGTPTPQSGPHSDSQFQAVDQGRFTSPSRPSTGNPVIARQSRLRRKIEYIPLAREVDTYGGRDLETIDSELSRPSNRRPQRSVDEWGTIDIDGLTMSLRSRLPTELSYAITVLSVLSTMRGQSPDTGFSLQQCDDLLDELLELLREQAFAEAEDVYHEGDAFCIHRELVSLVRDNELQCFSDQPRMKIHADLKKPTAADIVFAILNLFRNFSLTGENQRFVGQHPEVLGLVLRLSSLSIPFSDTSKGQLPSPASPALSLPELVKARKDVLTIVSNLVPFINLALHPPQVHTRLFELLASFLVESHDLSSPAGIVIQSGAISAGTVRPPLVVDLALEAFSKLAQPDANRHALSRGIDLPWLWTLFSALVHRLPLSTEDFAITMRMHDVWLSYIEKVVLSIYSICFLAPPELKDKIKTDRALGFPKLILRMVKRFVSINHPDARQYFLVSSRRAIEALKLIDEGNDAFESPQSSGPIFAFGMGFGESDVKQMETGVGLLAAFQDDVTWNIMMMPHLDDVMFAELDSLSRISL